MSNEVPLGSPCMLGPLGEDIGLCSDDGYCLKGNAVNDGSLGTCTPRAAIGQACSPHPPGTPCGPDAACEGGICVPNVKRQLGESCEQARCDTGLHCENLVCQPSTLAVGEACGIANGIPIPGECATGLHCTVGAPLEPTICKPLPQENEPCPDDVCAPGLACDRGIQPVNDPNPKICKAPRGLDERCGSALSSETPLCQAGLVCRAQTCQLPCR